VVNYITVCGQNVAYFSSVSNIVLSRKQNKYNKHITNNSSQYPLHIGCDEKYIAVCANTKFLGLQTDNHLSCKNHIDQFIPK
jgi:hypothetical protein